MQVVPRDRLPILLRSAGLDPQSREFPDNNVVHRLTVREHEPMAFTGGAHRKLVYPDGRVEGPFPVADRPALSRFIATAFDSLGADAVLATVSEGTFWLNNKAQAAYLARVPDALRVTRFLRMRGLNDRFRGGFRVERARFFVSLPWLAANTYAGGGDVQFVVLQPASIRLTALACHHFDIHFASPDSALIERLAALAAAENLLAEMLELPDLPDWTETWAGTSNEEVE